jgi:hypothetical protein
MTRRSDPNPQALILGGFVGMGAVFHTIGFLSGTAATLGSVTTLWLITASIFACAYLFSS